MLREPTRAGSAPRVVARDSHAADLAKRTLTNLYNARPTWLVQAHETLDAAVFAAYGRGRSRLNLGLLPTCRVGCDA